MELNDVLGQDGRFLGLSQHEMLKLQKLGVRFDFYSNHQQDWELWDTALSGGWSFSGTPERYRVSNNQTPIGDQALIDFFNIPASVSDPQALGLDDPATMPERQHCELDWCKPAGPFDPFKGFTVESDPGHEPLDDAGNFGKATTVDNHGRTSFINPLNRV